MARINNIRIYERAKQSVAPFMEKCERVDYDTIYTHLYRLGYKAEIEKAISTRNIVYFTISKRENK